MISLRATVVFFWLQLIFYNFAAFRAFEISFTVTCMAKGPRTEKTKDVPRVEKIYKPTRENIFACRHCHDITYRRCNISGKPTEIVMYKKRKIAEKLEADDSDVSLGA